MRVRALRPVLFYLHLRLLLKHLIFKSHFYLYFSFNSFSANWTCRTTVLNASPFRMTWKSLILLRKCILQRTRLEMRCLIASAATRAWKVRLWCVCMYVCMHVCECMCVCVCVCMEREEMEWSGPLVVCFVRMHLVQVRRIELLQFLSFWLLHAKGPVNIAVFFIYVMPTTRV